MPAKLPEYAPKTDIRIYQADLDFLRPYLAARNITVNDFVRRVTRLAANAKRKEVGQPPLPEH